MAPERTAMGIALLLPAVHCGSERHAGSDLCTWIKIEHIAIVDADAQHLAPAIAVSQEHGWQGCLNQRIRTDPHARAQLHHCPWLPLRSRRRA
jgi:hypothetical protein